MKSFRLERQTPGRTLTKLFVKDDRNAICGVISVANESVNDLLACWKDVPRQSSPNAADTRENATAAMKAAFMRGPKLTRDAAKSALWRSAC